MPVSPSTLLAALKIINAFYVVDRQNKNTKKITEICTSMIDKFAALLNDMLKIRTTLDSALKKLNGKGNIINQIKQIEELGTKGSKEIPEIPEDIEE
jgi:DNA recombination protein RmuC